MSDLDPQHVEQVFATFDSITVGGVWGIPRSGLLYEKLASNRFHLRAAMPHEPGMSMTADELREAQELDHEGMRLHLAERGVLVTGSVEEAL